MSYYYIAFPNLQSALGRIRHNQKLKVKNLIEIGLSGGLVDRIYVLVYKADKQQLGFMRRNVEHFRLPRLLERGSYKVSKKYHPIDKIGKRNIQVTHTLKEDLHRKICAVQETV